MLFEVIILKSLSKGVKKGKNVVGKKISTGPSNSAGRDPSVYTSTIRSSNCQSKIPVYGGQGPLRAQSDANRQLQKCWHSDHFRSESGRTG